MSLTNKMFRTLALLLATSAQLVAFAPINFFKPYDYALRIHNDCNGKRHFTFGANVEGGLNHQGKSWNGESKNVFKLYEDSQSVVAALRGAPAGSLADAELVRLAGIIGGPRVSDDGVRGHVDVNGEFTMMDLSVYGRYELPIKAIPGHLGFSMMLPIRDARVKSTRYADLTVQNFPMDAAVAALVSSQAAAASTMKTYGGLDWSNWSKTDVGDLVVMLDWSKSFEQNKGGLKNVELLVNLGLSVPTAEQRDEDKAFAVALGNDGAWSLPFALGLNLDFNYHIRIGVDAQFEVIFDHTKEYRMKTDDHQTRFMLLNKGSASMDHGFTWNFNLLAQAYRFAYGMSLGFGYQYLKHDDDRLTPQSNAFDANIVNTANWLKEYNTHNLIFKFNWDGKACKQNGIAPQLSLFYKLPVDGKNMMQQDTFGGQVAINF